MCGSNRKSPAAATKAACAAARSTCPASSDLPGPWNYASRRCRASNRGSKPCATGFTTDSPPTLDGVSLNGPALERDGLRLAGNLNVSFEYVDGEALLMNLKDLAVSSGSACTSANPEPSHVLRALGLADDAVRSSLRFGLGRFNTAEEIELCDSNRWRRWSGGCENSAAWPERGRSFCPARS